jgi:hypothetical protein
MKLRLALFALCVSSLTGCGFGRVTIVVTATSSPYPTPTLPPTNIPTSTPPSATATPEPPTATPVPVGVPLWMAPNVPPEFQQALDPLVKSGQYVWKNEADARIKLISGKGDPASLTAQWVYVPVVPFPTVADDVRWEDIRRYWKGDTAALASLSGNKQPPVFVAASTTIKWLTDLLGTASPNVKIESVPPDGVVTTLWLRRPAAWSLVPFNRLDPAMKALTLDGQSVFNRALALDKYPLVETFAFTGDSQLIPGAMDSVKKTGKWLTTNRDLSRMTIIVMTGVTALTRATAYEMEIKGITLPARDILPFVQDADFVHTSNEVAFAANCPYPNPSYAVTGLRFCSRDSYLELLKTIRLNIVELTGNHVNDWGTDAFAHTLDIYDANKMLYYGGGRNDEDARKAKTITHNGNTVAFIGCNPAGPAPAWATTDQAGSAKCDDTFIAQEIQRLKAAGNVVVMSLQYQEYYQYDAPADQVAFFGKYAQMGADLVMGSQAHQPQGFAFTGNAFIHYGIGNIFFDQMDALATRQMFADKLIFYEGRHVSTVLFTGLNEDYSRPRPMTPAERSAFLQTIFKASGW